MSGKNETGIVGMGISAVVPQGTLSKSAAIVGAWYPVGATVTVVVVAL